MKHISDAQKADRLARVIVGNVAKTDSAVSFAIKIPEALPLQTVSPETSKGDLARLLGTHEGIAVTQGDNVYRVILNGEAKAAYDRIEAAGKEQAAAATASVAR